MHQDVEDRDNEDEVKIMAYTKKEMQFNVGNKLISSYCFLTSWARLLQQNEQGFCECWKTNILANSG